MSSSTPFWIFLLLLLSAPAGYFLSEKNIARKEYANRIAQERQRLATERLRFEVAERRKEAVGLHVDSLTLKNKRTLENVTIKNFTADGISFSSPVGGAHAVWADLPSDWVEKYRDPVTAALALSKAEAEAAAVAEMERLGVDVQVSLVRVANSQDPADFQRGSVVKVITARKSEVWRDVNTNIFLMNTGSEAFINAPIAKLRVYPIGNRFLLYTKDKDGIVVPGERLQIYTSTAQLALSYTRAAHISITDLAKIRLGF